jgi:hypothetical protein
MTTQDITVILVNMRGISSGFNILVSASVNSSAARMRLNSILSGSNVAEKPEVPGAKRLQVIGVRLRHFAHCVDLGVEGDERVLVASGGSRRQP